MTKTDVFPLKTVLQQGRTIFHPIDVLLLAFGLDLKRRSDRLMRFQVFLGFFFHLVWFLVSANAVACFDATDVTYHAFTIIKFVCSLMSWWILRRNRAGLSRVLDLLSCVRAAAGAGEGESLRRWVFRAYYFAAFVVFGPGFICCLKLLAQDEFPMFFCPLHQAAFRDKTRARLLHFWLLTGFNYISRGLPFVVTLFYSVCCLEAVRLARFLAQAGRGKVAFMRLLRAVMALEEAFSALVFLQFVNAFLEILRIETVVLMYLKGRWHFDIIVHSLYYALVGATSFLAMILSADQVQSACHACRVVLRDPLEGPGSVEGRLKSLLLQVEYLQDVRHVRLTAWGVFRVKRDLLLSIFALYISYGVLIAQITP